MVTINMQKENLLIGNGYNQYAKRKPTEMVTNMQKENLLIGNGYNQYAKRKPTNWQWLQSICQKKTY